MNKVCATGILSLSLASGAVTSAAEVKLTWVPDYSSPEYAWRVSVGSTGAVALERSDVAVTTLHSDFHWIPDTASKRRQLSKRKVVDLFAALNELELSGLAAEYSAERSWLLPGETAKEIGPSGEVHEVPARVDRVITHGEHYGLSYHDKSAIDSTVYAPFAALDDAGHPNRIEIQKLITAWYLVLKATGPVADISAKSLKSYSRVQ